ncbi:MAG: nucleotidyl transferase AbiEii/AbiGii toxin family protein [Micrococcales bacterium]|nr:nucleotidyl transferase AbiEii/AbiGii toxin family protein [Micrococcales bacterium]
MLSGFHLRVSQVVLEAVEPLGFALGGGYALQAHGIIDRLSTDLDTYTATMDTAVFDAAESAAVAALETAGLGVDVVRSDSWFRALRVYDLATDDAVAVDLGYDYRQHAPTAITGIGPVLDVADVVVGKVRALWDRQAARDYLDIDAVLATGRWDVDGLQKILTSIRPEAGPHGMAELLDTADTVEPEEYAAYGLAESQAKNLVARLRAAAATSRST